MTLCPALQSCRSVDDNNLLLGSAEDDQLVAESVKFFQRVGKLWDSTAEENLVLLLGCHLTVLVPYGLDCVDLTES